VFFLVQKLVFVCANELTALRAIREAAFTWGDVHERYLSSAIHFANDFKGWTGFGAEADE